MTIDLNKREYLLTKDDLCQVSLKLTSFVNVFFTILLLSPHGKGLAPSFEQAWIPFTQKCFVQSLSLIGPVVLAKKIFKFLQCNFNFSLLSSLGEKGGSLIKHTWIPITDGCFVLSLSEICLKVLKKKNIFNFRTYMISLYPKDVLRQVWLKLAWWFWRRKWNVKIVHAVEPTTFIPVLLLSKLEKPTYK